jgi:hypothetical protein
MRADLVADVGVRAYPKRMKRNTVLSVSLLSTFVLVPFTGCSSSNGGTGFASAPDSGGGGSPGIIRSSNDSGAGQPSSGPGNTGDTTGDDAGSACLGALTGFQAPGYTAPKVQANACASADIQAFISACLDSSDQSACDTWANSNVASDAGAGTACGNCIFSADGNGAVWFDPNAGVPLPNYGACIALTDPTNGAACAGAVNDAQSCQDVACGSCMDQTSYDGCATAANSGECASYGSALQTSCKSDQSAFSTCFPSQTSMNQDDDWTLIINMVCGAGSAADGG